MIIPHQDIEFVRHGKDYMKIGNAQDFAFPFCNPALTQSRLAFWAIAIAAAIEGVLLVAAATGTIINVASEHCRAASLDGAKRFLLLEIHAGSILFEESMALNPDNVGNLKWGLGHGDSACSALVDERER
jgi:hypothetical protein